jgi:hypothetical protein
VRTQSHKVRRNTRGPSHDRNTSTYNTYNGAYILFLLLWTVNIYEHECIMHWTSGGACNVIGLRVRRRFHNDRLGGRGRVERLISYYALACETRIIRARTYVGCEKQRNCTRTQSNPIGPVSRRFFSVYSRTSVSQRRAFFRFFIPLPWIVHTLHRRRTRGPAHSRTDSTDILYIVTGAVAFFYFIFFCRSEFFRWRLLLCISYIPSRRTGRLERTGTTSLKEEWK